MGYFKDEEIKRVTLSDPKYWVEIPDKLQWRDLKKFAVSRPDGQVDFEASADLYLQTVIKAWNLDDENGNVVPITPENIDRLERQDVMLLISEAGDVADSDSSKKNSPSS